MSGCTHSDPGPHAACGLQVGHPDRESCSVQLGWTLGSHQQQEGECVLYSCELPTPTGWPQGRELIPLVGNATGSHLPYLYIENLNSFPQSNLAGELPLHCSLLPSKRQPSPPYVSVYFHPELSFKSWPQKTRQGGARAPPLIPTALLLRTAGGAWNI